MSKFPRADKKLGQHFLNDAKTIEIITTDHADKCDMIVEVGPGPGVLTKKLSEHQIELNLIEKDQRFVEDLSRITPNIYNADALEFQWDEFLMPYQNVWLVSNLPYNVGTPLFLLFLQKPQIKYMTLMFQKEVGEKTYLRETKNSTNGLLTLSSIYFDSKPIRKVSPGCFTPPPKVDSIVVSYTRKSQPIFEIEQFAQIDRYCRLIFSNKRKQLRSVLKGSLKPDALDSLPPDFLQKRAEALTLAETYDVMRHLIQYQV